jgi:CheY-like chemotaxis protein
MAAIQTILAIDDLPLELAVFENILGNDYNLKISTSAPEAFTLLKTFTPNLILLDIEMPGMSGFEFLHQIRKIPALMSTPVIIVTSHSGKEFSDHAIGEGANDVLGKPVNPQDLKNRVVQLLENPPKGKLESLFSKLPAINLN